LPPGNHEYTKAKYFERSHLSFSGFALLQNGADATAQKQMSDVFGWQTLTPAQIYEESAALRQALTYCSTAKAENRSVRRPQGTGEHLIMSGSLRVKNQLSFGPNLLDINKKFFGFVSATLADSDKAAARAITIGPHARPALRGTALSTRSMAMISFCWVQLGLRAHGCNLSRLDHPPW
jgi:hypothetical protein